MQRLAAARFPDVERQDLDLAVGACVDEIADAYGDIIRARMGQEEAAEIAVNQRTHEGRVSDTSQKLSV